MLSSRSGSVFSTKDKPSNAQNVASCYLEKEGAW